MGVTEMNAFWILTLCRVTQGSSGGKVNILGGNSIGHCEKKKSSFEHVSTSEWLLR